MFCFAWTAELAVNCKAILGQRGGIQSRKRTALCWKPALLPAWELWREDDGWCAPVRQMGLVLREPLFI